MMERSDRARTVEDLLTLPRGAALGQVDALVDAYLIGTDPKQVWQKRAELALEFLNAAPSSELSYRIWCRIGGEDDGAELPYESSSMQFLPAVDFKR